MRCPECGSLEVVELPTGIPGELVCQCRSCEYGWSEQLEPDDLPPAA